MADYILYHYPLCPFSREIRFFLDELGIKYKTKEVKFWKRELEFVKLNPIAETPVLIDKMNDIILSDSFVIAEYLNSIHNSKSYDLAKIFYIPDDEIDKAEVRRLELLFGKKFYNDVVKYILEEKIYNILIGEKMNLKKLKAGQANLIDYLKYAEFLLDKRKWLAGETFTLADIVFSSQLSSLDYFGEVDWKKNKILKNWYLIIKSKPSFRNILKDNVGGFIPSKNYCKLDFD